MQINNAMRDALLKAGKITQQDVQRVEQEKERIKKLEEENRRMREEKERGEKFRKERDRDRIVALGMLGEMARNFIASTHRTYKELTCGRCGVVGSSRLDYAAAMQAEIETAKNFLWLIDNNAQKELISKLKEKVGAVIERDVVFLDGEKRYVYLCVVCKQEVLAEG